MERLRFIDGDAHILEPQDIWDEYLEKKYKGAVGKGFARWAHASTLAQGEARLQEKGQEDPLVLQHVKIEVMGRQVPNRAPRDPRVGADGNPLVQGTDSDQAFGSTANQETGVTIIEDRELNDLSDAYGKWADENFPARAYREVMDTHGIDYMILYPTVGFWITGAAEMDGETATAIRRAYNRWLGDFTKDIGHGACGAASIDLRDPELARKEVERCVKEYDFKGGPPQPCTGAEPASFRRSLRPAVGNLRRPWRAHRAASKRQPPVRPGHVGLHSGPEKLPHYRLLRHGQHDGLHLVDYGRCSRAPPQAEGRLPRVRLRMGVLLA